MSDLPQDSSQAVRHISLVESGRIPVVGIGCSAGGLEALNQFFSAAPSDAGLAFVVVQHLSPTHHSALPELLRASTSMPVEEVTDGTVVHPDHVYVIPPNCDLSLLQGVLHLTVPSAARGLRLPIDHFLISLADDCQDKPVGVLLSGMGSDGVLGLAAIKARAGLTLVQEPASAGADGMPSSAIKARVADIIAKPQELPERILEFLGRAASHRVANEAAAPNPGDDSAALAKILLLLHTASGSDFSLYKSNTLLRRIERRMAVHHRASLDDYARLLQGEPQELGLLFRECLIGVTSFFRDPAVWDQLRDVALPQLLARFPAGKILRAWVPACSTGEEAYTLAMVFTEAARAFGSSIPFTLQIFATDLDDTAVEFARKGVYPASIAADVSAERLAEFFSAEEGGGFRVKKHLREMLVFAKQNLASDPPFTRLDILSCRNLLIYFDVALQRRILPLFHYALNPDGLLVLGSAESAGSFEQMFVPIRPKERIYRRSQQPRGLPSLNFSQQRPTILTLPDEPPIPDRGEAIGRLTDQLVQQTWAPAAVLVNANGDILYISGRTGKYLEPAVGRTNINIHAMAREGLREALAGVIHRAIAEERPILLRGLRVGTNGGTQVVNVTVQALDKPELLRGRVIVVFSDVATPAKRRKSVGAGTSDSQGGLQDELQQARDALQATHEAMQISVEELQSSNEELQSTNEELQSTNEELTTSKEELQSVNEELQTVNAELQSKVDDLTRVKNDMANLLNSTDIATIFLDANMNVRQFTPYAVKLFRLIPGDIGRPLAHVVNDLDYPQLVVDAAEVLRTLVFKETTVATADGRWYRVRAMPYRTQDNVIEGVVITFTDVTAIKQLEAELRSHGP